MCNQDLVKYLKPAIFLNKLLGKNNKFVLDVRTLPTVPETFEKDMVQYQRQIKHACKSFDGLSFITPFLEKVSLSSNNGEIPTVNWSSGVNIDLFDADRYDYTRDTKAFRIFYHGGISHSRGNMDLIKACEIIAQKGYSIELVQIGKIVDKDLKTYISKKESDIGVSYVMPNLYLICQQWWHVVIYQFFPFPILWHGGCQVL